jgi:hypothetical protein
MRTDRAPRPQDLDPVERGELVSRIRPVIGPRLVPQRVAAMAMRV